MTKKTYTKPKLVSIGHIPMEFIEKVLNLNQAAISVLDYWLIYKKVQDCISQGLTVMDSFMKVGEAMHKPERTVEAYYYRAKKIIDSLNIEI